MAIEVSLSPVSVFHLYREGAHLLVNGTVVSSPFGFNQRHFIDWLSASIAVSTGKYARLLLDCSLDVEWQQFPWERFPWNGGMLGEYVQIVRRYSVGQLVLNQGRSLLLDQWPDFAFLKCMQPYIHSGKVDARRGNSIDAWLAASPDLSTYREVFIVAHGATLPDPLLNERGEPWLLKLPEKLPAIVWLLACEEDEGNFDALIEDCFMREAQCVISSDRHLSAASMVRLICDWLENKNVSLIDWLHNWQGCDSATGGADSLQVHGKLPVVMDSISK
jgi:hypothetical protein